jgi:hypothetical protein
MRPPPCLWVLETGLEVGWQGLASWGALRPCDGNLSAVSSNLGLEAAAAGQATCAAGQAAGPQIGVGHWGNASPLLGAVRPRPPEIWSNFSVCGKIRIEKWKKEPGPKLEIKKLLDLSSMKKNCSFLLEKIIVYRRVLMLLGYWKLHIFWKYAYY